jgi:hypothetical protein
MAVDARRLWADAKPGLTKLWRLVGAFALAYLFMLLLITAWLQTSVSEKLAEVETADGAHLDYSSGYALWRAAQQNQDALGTLLKQQRVLIDKIEEATVAQTRALDAWQSTMESHDLMMRRLAAVPGCEFLRANQPGNLTTESVLSDLRACLDQGRGLSAAQRQTASELLGRADKFRAVDIEYRSKLNDAAALQRGLDRVTRNIAARSRTVPDRVKASEAFAEFAAFTDGRLGGGNFGSLPPAVIQILLAFVSGMFGALLVTLVLVVYPKAELKLSQGGSSIEARIFLGGLIALCVFVVLGGGTAVLGTSQGFGDGDANFLAFCAISILAGMFSDRVAQWLSGRADAFFSREDEDERGESAEGEAAEDEPAPKEEPSEEGKTAAPAAST